MNTSFKVMESLKDIMPLIGKVAADVRETVKGGSENSFSKEKIIKAINNKIYFYSDINRVDILQLIEALKNMEESFISEQINRNLEKPSPIFLHLNSYGGNVFSGFAAMDTIQQCKCETVTVIDGICASAATFLSLVGDKRYMHKHAVMLIHQLWSVFWGKYEEFEDEKKNMDMLMQMIKSVYKQYTKIPMKKLDGILKHDLLFNAHQCLEYGLVDEII
jgi:ATP-dependent Clp endopeptidase proteolytic subunit ClpP